MSDLIDREEALRALKDAVIDRFTLGDSYAEVLEAAIAAEDAIKAVPSAEKRGKWVIEPDSTVMHCDVCGWAFEYYAGLEEDWNFCPHCGARMESEE